MDFSESSVLSITPLILLVFFVAFRKYQTSQLKVVRLAKNKILYYRIVERPKTKYYREHALKAWVKLSHHQYLEYANILELVKVSSPFLEGDRLAEIPEFQQLVSNFPLLQVKEILIKHQKLEVLAAFTETVSPKSLAEKFPEEIENWFSSMSSLIESNPGKPQNSFPIKFDKYTEVIVQYAGLLVPLALLGQRSFWTEDLSAFMALHWKWLPYAYLVSMAVVFLFYFRFKKSLFLRSLSKLLVLLLIFMFIHLGAHNLKS